MWAQAPSAFAQPTNALLSAYFSDAGTAGSVPTSRSLCRMMTVAWRVAAIFSQQSMNDTVAALPRRQQDRIVLDGPALQIRRGDRPVDSTFYRDRVCTAGVRCCAVVQVLCRCCAGVVQVLCRCCAGVVQ